MPATSLDTRPLHLTITPNAGSCEHFYHFLLGYLLPLAAYIARRGIAEDRAIILRDCGPLGRILRELALPGLLCCERFTHASIRKTLQHSPWAEIDEIEAASRKLLHSLQTTAPARNREAEAAKAKTRSALRFSRVS